MRDRLVGFLRRGASEVAVGGELAPAGGELTALLDFGGSLLLKAFDAPAPIDRRRRHGRGGSRRRHGPHRQRDAIFAQHPIQLAAQPHRRRDRRAHSPVDQRQRRLQHGRPLEAAITTRAHQQVERLGAPGLAEVEEEVRFLHLAGQLGLEEQLRQQMPALVVGEREHGVVGDRKRELGGHGTAARVARRHGQAHLAARRVAALVERSADLQALAPVAEDEPLGHWVEVLIEQRDARDARGALQCRVLGPQVHDRWRVVARDDRGRVDQPVAQRRGHRHGLPVAAAHGHSQGALLAVDVVEAAQHAAVQLGQRQRHLLRDARRPRDLGVVAAAGGGREGDAAQPVLHAGEDGDRVAEVVDEAPLDVGRLAVQVLRLEVEPRRQPVDQPAAFGVERQRKLLLQDRDRLRDRLGDAAILDQDRQQPVAGGDRLRQVELDQRAALGIARDVDARQLDAVDRDHGRQGLAGQRLAGGPAHLDGGAHRLAGTVGLLDELELLLRARALVGRDDDVALAGLTVGRGHAQPVLTALRFARQREVVAGAAGVDAQALLHDRGALGRDQLDYRLRRLRTRERARFEVPGLEPDRLAGPVQRLVGLQVQAPADVAVEPACDKGRQVLVVG